MSIWCSRTTIGHDSHYADGDHPGGVRNYADGWSNHYPDDAVERPAAVMTGTIAPHCVPGADESEDYPTSGPWLRLALAVWDDEYGRPMIRGGATVILDPDAARALARDLMAWADEPHVEPVQ